MPRVIVSGRGLVRSFGYAFAGLAYAVRTQRNMRIHLFLAFVALAVALFLHLAPDLFLVLSLAVTMVLAAEMFNTALEAAVDLYGTTFRPLARVAKDVSAAAVLVTAANALATGLFLFLPRLAGLVPLFLAVVRAWPVVLVAAGLSLTVRSVMRSTAPGWGVAASFALGTWLMAGLPGPALLLLLAGLVLAYGRGPFRLGSFLGGMALGVLVGLLGAYFRF
ncbi:MAG TPA: diacylglycerol kinase family protein [Spirochaetia bacterium]|nr:diacylglycerol kinase family protein [Spirochaetia bacterium]